METKFTPWRMHYIKRDSEHSTQSCVFCAMAATDEADDPRNLILARGTACFVVMNLYPYNTAHLMVVPYTHTADLPGLASDGAQELFDLTRRCVTLLGKEYAPHGFNLGMNLGQIAGAGIAEHLHMHIVPRWSGDTNFMPLIGGTKLIPEELPVTYERLRRQFQADEMQAAQPKP
ncbi:MAG: HIT domain-containing protein [Oscillochloris sp.]|nr:HIT domain-containing protein [Oscillochloris sp.]